jgi:very-short-patch-repair endonuclease
MGLWNLSTQIRYWRFEMNYSSLNDKEKEKVLKQKYIKEKLSFAEIAKEFGTYANKVRRDASKLGIQIRTRSQAAKIALECGRSEHPTQGKGHTEETKLKISESQGKVWDSLDDQERLVRSQIGKVSWESKSESEKRELLEKGSQAIREASRIGSKMERYLLYELTQLGYDVQFHREHLLRNQRLEIDLYVNDTSTAIEVDGPSHFEPVWGEENLERNKRSDRQKTGLIISEGMVLIRIKQDKRSSQRYFRRVLEQVVQELEKITKEFPKEDQRYIEI